jgi:hypothetical protein
MIRYRQIPQISQKKVGYLVWFYRCVNIQNYLRISEYHMEISVCLYLQVACLAPSPQLHQDHDRREAGHSGHPQLDTCCSPRNPCQFLKVTVLTGLAQPVATSGRPGPGRLQCSGCLQRVRSANSASQQLHLKRCDVYTAPAMAQDL